jgi:hypothetical protein
MMNGTIANGLFRHGANSRHVADGTYKTTYLITGASRGLPATPYLVLTI